MAYGSVTTLDINLYPAPGSPAFLTASPDRQRMLEQLRRPERLLETTSLDAAIVHCNVSAASRGRGAGEQLVTALLSKLAGKARAAAARVTPGNDRAAAFWRRLGFAPESEGSWVFVKRL